MAMPGLNLTPDARAGLLRRHRALLEAALRDASKLTDVARSKKIAMQTGTVGYRDACVLSSQALNRGNVEVGHIQSIAPPSERSVDEGAFMSLKTLTGAFETACLDANPASILRAREAIRSEESLLPAAERTLPAKRAGPSPEAQARAAATRSKTISRAEEAQKRVQEAMARRFRERGY